jgi:hypothetical protein
MMVGFFCLWVVYNGIAQLLFKDYWTIWILDPMSRSVSGSSSPSAG